MTIGPRPYAAKPDIDWLSQAACVGKNPDLFFPNDRHHGAADEALAICSTCPVVQPCRDYALDTRQRYGVYGGMTARQRRTLSRRRARDARRAVVA